MAILWNRGLVGIPVKNGILADKCVFGLTFIKIIRGNDDFTAIPRNRGLIIIIIIYNALFLANMIKSA